MISSRAYVRPKSCFMRFMIASFSAGIPSFAVYLVKFCSMAWIPAAFTLSGVEKSGSPTLRSTTSIPSAFIALALADILRVGDMPI
ncbi:hypothetical protein ES703_44655 [subsurface metagenome]